MKKSTKLFLTGMGLLLFSSFLGYTFYRFLLIPIEKPNLTHFVVLTAFGFVAALIFIESVLAFIDAWFNRKMRSGERARRCSFLFN